MPANLLVTGPPGCGKTTLMVRLARSLRRQLDADLQGFVTVELRQGERRVGFRAVPFDGQARTMAHADFVSPTRVGRYGVDPEVVSYLADTHLRRPAARLTLLDEIGKMECLSPRFVAATRQLLDAPRPLVATVAERGEGFIAEVKRRDDVTLWTLSPHAADELLSRVQDWLAPQLGDADDGPGLP